MLTSLTRLCSKKGKLHKKMIGKKILLQRKILFLKINKIIQTL